VEKVRAEQAKKKAKKRGRQIKDGPKEDIGDRQYCATQCLPTQLRDDLRSDPANPLSVWPERQVKARPVFWPTAKTGLQQRRDGEKI
jgi:hypothetical protein